MQESPPDSKPKGSALMSCLTIPADHPQRQLLHNEVHARPPAALQAPLRASHLAMMTSAEEKAKNRQALAALCARFGQPAPDAEASHFMADFGDFSLRWEQHSEFSSYTFYRSGAFDDPFAESALCVVPEDWLHTLPGRLIVGAHAAIQSTDSDSIDPEQIAPLLGDNTLIGARVAGGAAWAFTDFHIHAEGFSRFLVLDRSLGARQAGRLLQRLLEIEVYRMMALLAFPIARNLIPELNRADRQLLEITTAMSQNEHNEADLLERLTALAAEVEHSHASTQFRLSASEAYSQLVTRRITDLREERIQGIQTFDEFMERRLQPALNTCLAVEQRQHTLSERIARTGQLLRTRVEVSLEQQNQSLLASMDRRAKLQLRLQETLEGLSTAAITYYTVSLIGYLAKAGQSLGVPVNPSLAIGLSVPVVGIATILGVRMIRRRIEQAQ